MREEAIMLLRQFYVQENLKGRVLSMPRNYRLNTSIAPDPRIKKSRELKTEIPPISPTKAMKGTLI